MQTWNAFGRDRHEQAQEEMRDPAARHSSKQAEQSTFNESLADQTSAACAERRAHGKFALAAGGAREKQACDICARDEKYGEDGTQQYPRSENRIMHLTVAK